MLCKWEGERADDQHFKHLRPTSYIRGAFDLALVVALARSSEAIGEQIVGLQLAEDPSP